MKHLIERTPGFSPSLMLCAARFRDISIVGRATNRFLLGMLMCGAIAPTQAEPVNKSPTSVSETAGGQQKTAQPLTNVLRIVQDPTGRQLQSAFIWTGATASGSNAGVAVGFRKSFSLEQKPSSAFLHLFADARYVLWVNGTYVERGPSRFQPNGPEYDSVEIAPLLQAGKNSVALLCIGNLSGGKVMRHEPGMTAVLQIGKQLLWSTDESWKWTDYTRFRSVSASWANLGESMVDARVEDGDWTLLGYDDSHWKTSTRISGTSWGPLTARRIPLLRETDVPVSLTNGVTLPVTLKAGEKMEFSAGRMVQAYPLITLEAEAGTVLRIEPHGVTYVAKAGPQSYFTTDTRGFINGSVTVSNGRATITGFKLVERLYPFDCPASFTSSDPFLDRLWSLSARSCQVLSEDSYVDCADRERAEWMDDTPPAYDITRTAMAVTGSDGHTNYGDPRLLGVLIRRTALTLQPEGWVKAHTCSDRYDIHAKMEDRACDWVEGIRLYEEATGDKEAVREVWPALVVQMDYFLNRRTERGLVRARDWVVWANPVGYFTGEGTTLNVFVYRALEDAAKLGALIGEETDSRRFSKAADELKRAINTVLWDEAAGTYAAGYFTDADIAESKRKLSLPRKNNIAAPTLYSSVFALDRGVVPPERRERVLQAMLKQKPSEKRHVMIYYYLAKQLYGLDAPAYDQQVLDIFRENWVMMVDAPYQCSWEVFGGGSSKAHIYGMYPGYFLSSFVLGVRRDVPVYSKELRIEPHLADLDRAQGTVITEFGPVPVAWTKAGVELKFTLKVPPGIKTTLSLPYRDGHESIQLDGKDVLGDRQGNRLEIPLRAGDHQGSY
jgi:alpha-L-rhamnosidase